MMIDLVMLYAFIFGMSIFNWAFNRWMLYRGLDAAFMAERQKLTFDSFFASLRQRYTNIVIWTLLHVLVVGYVSARLLFLTGLWSWETAILGLMILVFFAKDRLHYATAILVMSRVRK